MDTCQAINVTKRQKMREVHAGLMYGIVWSFFYNSMHVFVYVKIQCILINIKYI